MSLKVLSFDQKRQMVLNDLLNKLKITMFGSGNYAWAIALEELRADYTLNCENFKNCVKFFYGENSTSDEQNPEWLLAQILFTISLIRLIYIKKPHYFRHNSDLEERSSKWKNILEKYSPDYKIKWEKLTEQNAFIPFEYSKFTPVVENLKNISEEKATPIIELLSPNRSEIELSGLICSIYSGFEKIKPNDLKFLNQTDQNLYKHVWTFSKHLANKVDKVKGHKSDSELTITDIAHNFALNASLIEKFIEINSKNQQKNLNNDYVKKQSLKTS
ncbi:hypothetical protein [Mycoplasma sp. ATU-Cv-703]|uniref:hypothetical protein n=1 Tax=Mycoplasma sp. ATU-Cv-703 TaxID=2498595 RepID=UPI000FDEB3F0